MDSQKAAFNFLGSYKSGNNQYVGTTVNNVGGNVHLGTSSVEVSFFSRASANCERQKNANRNRVANTCMWVLESPLFQNFSQSRGNDVLRVTADPGCGKSVLSRTVIDERLVGTTTATICYFFFKDDGEQDDVSTALCAILHQLFCKHENLLHKYASSSVQNFGERLTYNREEMWRILLSATQDESTPEVVCVLDALDECKETDCNFLIEKIAELYNTTESSSGPNSSLKFLLTSRPYNRIEQHFHEHVVNLPVIELSGERESVLIGEEISRVINHRVAALAKDWDLSDEARDALHQRLQSIPQRTYLWLHLTLDELRHAFGHTPKKLLKAIEKLPQTVEKAYENILARCQNPEYAKTILQIIVAARRPLTIREMDVALEMAFHADANSLDDLDIEGETHRKEGIRSACGLFVNIVDGSIFLIHETAKEFLIRQNCCEGYSHRSLWRHSIQPRLSELLLAQICTSYLLLCAKQDTKGSHSISDSFDLKSARNAFIHYARDYWAEHARNADVEDYLVIKNSVGLCSIAETHKWLSLLVFRFPVWSPFENHKGSPRQQSLLAAVAFGLPGVVKVLLKDHPDISDHVLWAAAKSSDDVGLDLLKLLLNAQSGNSEISKRVFVAAASNEKHALGELSLLLDKRGDDITVSEELMVAAAGNTDGQQILEMLFDRLDAKILITPEVVLAAAENSSGHEVMKLLQKKRGKDVQYTGDVILAATRNWNKDEVINLLCERRVNNVKISPSIFKAIARNRDAFEVTDMLLDRLGGKLKITESIVTAVAGAYGGSKVMKCLLEKRGKDMKITEAILMAAAEASSGDRVMELLLEKRGEDVNITEAILMAADRSWDNDKVMQKLVEKRTEGVNINEHMLKLVVNNPRETSIIEMSLRNKTTEPVVVAAVQNWPSEQVVQLLKKGAITEAALQALIKRNRRSREEVMKILLAPNHRETESTEQVTHTVVEKWFKSIRTETSHNSNGNDIGVTWDMVVAFSKDSRGLLLLWMFLRGSGLYCREISELSLSFHRKLVYWPADEKNLPSIRKMLSELSFGMIPGTPCLTVFRLG